MQNNITCQAQIRSKAPDFSAKAFYKGEFKQISLSDYAGKYLVLFFYPFDFTFVCPTEILQFSGYSGKFRENNCEIVGSSIDSHFVHMQWCNTPRNQGGLGGIDIPLIADCDKRIARSYGCLIQDGEEKGAAFRATFIIDGKGILRHFSINDLGVGRSIEEILRLVQGFQFSDENGEVCPAKWKPGGKTIKPTHDSNANSEYWEKEHAKN